MSIAHTRLLRAENFRRDHERDPHRFFWLQGRWWRDWPPRHALPGEVAEIVRRYGLGYATHWGMG